MSIDAATGVITYLPSTNAEAGTYTVTVQAADQSGLEATQRRTFHRIRELRVAGGGSQSDRALQITADIFGQPVYRPRIHETSSLGAAMAACVGAGLHPDFETAIADMTGCAGEFLPRMENARVYHDLYRHVYKRLYSRLQPLFHRIKKVTGYPD